MRTEHAQDRRPLALRWSSRLSQNSEDQEHLPGRAPDIVSWDTSGRLQRDSTDPRAGAADDEAVSITSSTHYPPNRCEDTAEVLPLKSQQRDGMLQTKIIPHLEKEEGNRLNHDQSSISRMCYNKHAPKAANYVTGNIPVQSHDRPDTRLMSKKTAAIFDIVSERKIPNASQSVREKTPKGSESKHKMTKKEAISSSKTTQTTSLPGIESFQPDVFIDQKKKHNIQGCFPGIGLREVHDRSFRPWFAYRTARYKEVQAQLLSATKDVAQLNTGAEYFYLYEATPNHKLLEADGYDLNRGVSDCFGGHNAYCNAPEYARLLLSIFMNDARVLRPQTVEMMFQSQLSTKSQQALQENTKTGKVTIGDFYLGEVYNFGLGGMLVEDARVAGAPYSRGPRTLVGSGGTNQIWLIDRSNGLCGLFMTHGIPPCDLKIEDLLRAFQKYVYNARETEAIPSLL